MKKIRLAFFADMLLENHDGCARTIHQIIKRIPRDRVEVLFICGVKPREEKTFDYLEVPAMTIPFNTKYKFALPLLAEKQMTAALEDFQPDIIHVSSPSPLGVFAADYATNHHLPLVTMYHTHFLSYVKYYLDKVPAIVPLFEKTVVSYTKKLYDRATINYVPVQSVVDDLDRYDYRTDNCSLWPRGMNHEVFNTSKADIPWLQSITGNNKPTVFFASRLVWEKNLKTLIKIYKRVRKKQLGYNFVIAGSGPAEAKLKSKMPDAIFTGNLSHEMLAKYYASSDLFIFPSDTEAYGNVVIEAMACGTPVIAADGGGPSSIIEDGVNGILCPPMSHKEYVRKMKLVLKKKKFRNRLITNGLAYTKPLDWDKLVSSYFHDLETLVHQNQLKYA